MKDNSKSRHRMLMTRVRGTFGGKSQLDELEQDMDEEMRFHVEMATKSNEAAGMSKGEARRQALIAFGGIESMKEGAREEQRVRWFENVVDDVKFALRSLRKSPMFTVAAVLTVAIGIAANVSVFSVVNAVLLRPLPFPHPNDVRYVGWDWGRNSTNVTITAFEYDYMRRNNRSLEGVAAWAPTEASVGNAGSAAAANADNGSAPESHGLRASGDFFKVIGIKPAHGRTFTENETAPGAPGVVVISDGLWHSRFAADPGIIGRTIDMGGEPRTVIGIMPKSYQFPASSENIDFIVPWAPIVDARDEGHNVAAIARARHDWSAERRTQDVVRVSAQMHAEHPELESAQESFRMFTHTEAFASDSRATLLVLLGAVLFVMLIGCANTANLLLVRANGRQREVAVRAALGAGKIRIIQQMLTEGMVLSIVSAAFGIALGAWGLRILLAVAPASITPADQIGFDVRVLVFVLAVTVITGLIFGTAAALPALRVNLQDTLRRETRGTTGGGQRARDILVLAETALAVVLLAGAGLLLTSFIKIESVDAGFDSHNVFAVRLGRIPADLQKPDAQARLEDDLLTRIRAVTGVEAVAVASNFPLERGWNFPTVPVDNEDLGIGGMEWRGVTPGYFESLHIQLKTGREFNASDVRGAPRVAIVNETVAKHFWPGENPIGKRIDIGRFKGKWLDSTIVGETEVVGVTRDIREISLDHAARPTVLVPRAQAPDILQTPPSIIVRTRSGANISGALRNAVASASSRLTVPEIEPMRDIVGRSVAEQRFRMVIIGIFAACALLLAAIGIYGVIAATVQQKTQEIGIRMALGASRTQVALRVLRRTMTLVGIGALTGMMLAFGLTRFIASMLFSITATDPRTFPAVIVLLCAVGALAGYLPARRASRVDPGFALRGE